MAQTCGALVSELQARKGRRSRPLEDGIYARVERRNRLVAQRMAPQAEPEGAFQDRVQDALLEQVLEKNESTSPADVAAADASEGRATRHQVPGEQHH